MNTMHAVYQRNSYAIGSLSTENSGNPPLTREAMMRSDSNQKPALPSVCPECRSSIKENMERETGYYHLSCSNLRCGWDDLSCFYAVPVPVIVQRNLIITERIAF